MHPIRNILLAIVGAIALLVALAGGAYFVFVAKFNPAPPSADYPKPDSPLAAQRQDIDYFGRLIALDRAYSPAAREEAKRELQALSAAQTVLDRAHLRVALLQIAALADNGHTVLYSKKPVRPIFLPIRLADFADGFFVMRTMPDNADLLGAQVIAIDGKPVADVIEALKTLRGGTDAWRRGYAALDLTSSEYLYGLGIAPAPDRSSWTFRTIAGAHVTRTLSGVAPRYENPVPELWRWQSPEPVKADTIHWRAFAPHAIPVTFRDPDRNFRRVRIGCVILIQLKANEDVDGESLSGFLTDTTADLEKEPPCSVILDNRFNGGGDYTNTARFAAALPGHVAAGGHIYLLTSTQTFSAGITTTVFVKQAAKPGQVVILGAPVGDRLVFWAEGNAGCLPNAPFCFHYATGLHNYVAPCRDWDSCYWLNWIFPARTDSLAPAERIDTRFADFLAGRDPAFDRALALALKR